MFSISDSFYHLNDNLEGSSEPNVGVMLGPDIQLFL